MALTVEEHLLIIEAEPSAAMRALRLRDLTTIFPDAAPIWLRLCHVELALGHFEAAFTALDHALCLDLRACPELPSYLPEFWLQRLAALDYLARVAARGDREAELAALVGVRERFPDFTAVVFNQAVVLAALGRTAEARAAARDALAMSPGVLPLFPPAVVALVAPRHPPPPAADPMHLDRVGGYRVVRIAERGPDHVLYDAFSTSDGAPVTLRRLIGPPPEKARALFVDQARTPAISDDVIRVCGLVDVDGTPLQVLERVRGRSVLEAFAGGQRDPDEGIDLVWLVARAMHALHENHRYLHGRLGPANVMVTDDNLDRPFRLIDVGLHARIEAGGRSLPVHLAPETFASPAGDVYGLGVLLHYVLTGAVPEHGQVAGTRVPDAIRARVVPLLERCLDADPARRPRHAGEVAAQLETVFVEEPRPPPPGAVLDDWQLEDVMSDDGEFAVIHRAHHRQVPELRAAVKVLRPFYARHREVRHRFEREALATPDHPGIVRVWPRSTMLSGTPYYAMELLRGTSMRTALSAGPVSIHTVVHWALELAEALAFAHARHVVHRDVKPENVIVLAAGGTRHVKLLDFGIAKVANTSFKTRRGQLLGTSGYMAPEQLRGGDVDDRVDVYALGVLVLEALTGRHPFAHASNEPYQKVVGGEALAFLAGTAGNVRTDLEQLLREMTSEHARDRPPMARVFDRLGAVARHFPSSPFARTSHVPATAVASPMTASPVAPTRIAPGPGLPPPPVEAPPTAEPPPPIEPTRADLTAAATGSQLAVTPAPTVPLRRARVRTLAIAIVVAGGASLLGAAIWFATSAPTSRCDVPDDWAELDGPALKASLESLQRQGCSTTAREVAARRLASAQALQERAPDPARGDLIRWLETAERILR